MKTFDKSYGGTWFIIVGSSAAFLSSAIINNMLNWSLGKVFKGNPNSFCAFVLISFVSTAISQYIDDFVLAIIVSLNFFGWNIPQCLVVSFLKMVVELLFEIIFSPLEIFVFITYRKIKYWERIS